MTPPLLQGSLVFQLTAAPLDPSVALRQLPTSQTTWRLPAPLDPSACLAGTSPEVGEVSRSDGEVNSHPVFCPFKYERVVIRGSGIGLGDEIGYVAQCFGRR